MIAKVLIVLLVMRIVGAVVNAELGVAAIGSLFLFGLLLYLWDR